MSKFELIIFDCDGVLVDSERVANQVFAELLEELCGLSFSQAEMFRHFVGRSQKKCMQIVEDMSGKPPPTELVERYQLDINRALLDSVEAVNGVERVLQQIDIPYCVASSGSHEKMNTTLGKTGLADYFGGKLFSTSEVSHGKPHPHIYLHAAQSMGGIDPSRCLVVEDSPVGVEGASAANMTVFGYSELMDADHLLAAGAQCTFSRMSELPGLILRSV